MKLSTKSHTGSHSIANHDRLHVVRSVVMFDKNYCDRSHTVTIAITLDRKLWVAIGWVGCLRPIYPFNNLAIIHIQPNLIIIGKIQSVHLLNYVCISIIKIRKKTFKMAKSTPKT